MLSHDFVRLSPPIVGQQSWFFKFFIKGRKSQQSLRCWDSCVDQLRHHRRSCRLLGNPCGWGSRIGCWRLPQHGTLRGWWVALGSRSEDQGLRIQDDRGRKVEGSSISCMGRDKRRLLRFWSSSDRRLSFRRWGRRWEIHRNGLLHTILAVKYRIMSYEDLHQIIGCVPVRWGRSQQPLSNHRPKKHRTILRRRCWVEGRKIRPWFQLGDHSRLDHREELTGQPNRLDRIRRSRFWARNDHPNHRQGSGRRSSHHFQDVEFLGKNCWVMCGFIWGGVVFSYLLEVQGPGHWSMGTPRYLCRICC